MGLKEDIPEETDKQKLLVWKAWNKGWLMPEARPYCPMVIETVILRLSKLWV
jgi:hypothetical protein